MPSAYEIIVRLTEPSLLNGHRRSAMHAFASINGWLPSDQLEDYSGVEDIANGHIVVEHGFDKSAVITFLKVDSPFSRLTREKQARLLSISYNNLVDTHFFPN